MWLVEEFLFHNTCWMRNCVLVKFTETNFALSKELVYWNVIEIVLGLAILWYLGDTKLNTPQLYLHQPHNITCLSLFALLSFPTQSSVSCSSSTSLPEFLLGFCSHNRMHWLGQRWSTFGVRFFSSEIDHMTYLKLRKINNKWKSLVDSQNDCCFDSRWQPF